MNDNFELRSPKKTSNSKIEFYKICLFIDVLVVNLFRNFLSPNGERFDIRNFKEFING
jgi:hypothetical protein